MTRKKRLRDVVNKRENERTVVWKNAFALALSLVLWVNGSKAQAPPIAAWKLPQLETYLRSDSPTVINFWATWCAPCVEELPALLATYEKYRSKGVRLLLLSFDLKKDYASKISKFEANQKVKAPIVWFDETNADLYCPRIDSSWSGAIPATLFIRNGRYKKFIEGKMDRAAFEKEFEQLLP